MGEIKAPDETGLTLVGGQSQDASCEFFVFLFVIFFSQRGSKIPWKGKILVLNFENFDKIGRL